MVDNCHTSQAFADQRAAWYDHPLIILPCVICLSRFYFPLFATLFQSLRFDFQKRLSGQFRQDSAIRNNGISDQNEDWFPRCFQNSLLLLFWSETQVYVSFNEIGLIGLIFFALVFGSQYYHVLFIISLYIVKSENVKKSCFTRKSWKNVLCLPGGLKTKTIKKSSTYLFIIRLRLWIWTQQNINKHGGSCK